MTETPCIDSWRLRIRKPSNRAQVATSRRSPWEYRVGLDPSDYSAFHAVFGMVLTVIIALEFKKSLLVGAEGGDTVVQIRSVVAIALLAICRKIILLDLTEADAPRVVALAAAILRLGLIYWSIGVRERKGDEAA